MCRQGRQPIAVNRYPSKVVEVFADFFEVGTEPVASAKPCANVQNERATRRLTQCGTVDGVNEVEKRVQFLIEVDPVSTPKKLLGNLAAVALADNYTPSNRFESYKIESASFFFLTVLSDNPASGKRKQYESLEAATLSLCSSLSNKLTNIRLCHGVDSQAMIVAFQAAIDAIYFSPVDTES